MRCAPSMPRSVKLAAATALLMLAVAGNVLAEGVQASTLGLYAGLPGGGGRLMTPHSNSTAPLNRAAQRLLITTAENAPDLEMGWEATARAAMELDPQGTIDPRAPRYAVVLTQTHAEGRVHTAHVHPEALDTSLPVHPGPIHHEGGAVPWHVAFEQRTGSLLGPSHAGSVSVGPTGWHPDLVLGAA
ncbi:MAG: hypothetical protein P8Y02_00130 [Deinococcales bacterium]|jgi:hypothetical protein